MKYSNSSKAGIFYVIVMLLIPFFSGAQINSKNYRMSKGTPLVLGVYATKISKEIKQGTFLKVYVDRYSESLAKQSSAQHQNQYRSVFTGRITYKGQFFKVAGDSLMLVHRGSLFHIDIDEIIGLKQYYSPFRRIIGSMINGIGMYGMARGGGLGIAGVISMLGNGGDNGLGPVLLFPGLILGGSSFLIHRLGLLLRTNKYDLTEVWYIDRTASSGG